MSTEEVRYFNMIERLYKAADARVSDLEAECERLRAALRELVSEYAYDGCDNDNDCNCDVHALWSRVDAALAGAGKA